MSFLDWFKRPDLDAGLAQCRATEGAVLLDVRTPAEFAEGRIPGSRNLPLQQLREAASFIPDKDTPVFVYCHSGSRSSAAASQLKGMGYTNITDIGGIIAYHGKVER